MYSNGNSSYSFHLRIKIKFDLRMNPKSICKSYVSHSLSPVSEGAKVNNKQTLPLKKKNKSDNKLQSAIQNPMRNNYRK